MKDDKYIKKYMKRKGRGYEIPEFEDYCEYFTIDSLKIKVDNSSINPLDIPTGVQAYEQAS